jgi:hypothetical protein
MMPLICHRILFLLLSFLFIEMDESILWIDNYSNWIQLRRRRLGKGRMGKEPFDIDPNLTSRHYPPPPNHFSLNDDDGGLFIRHWSCGGRHASWVLFVLQDPIARVSFYFCFALDATRVISCWTCVQHKMSNRSRLLLPLKK